MKSAWLTFPLVILRFAFAFMICIVAMGLPYRIRLKWFSVVSFTVHLPFRIFGWLGHFLIHVTDSENPYRVQR